MPILEVKVAGRTLRLEAEAEAAEHIHSLGQRLEQRLEAIGGPPTLERSMLVGLQLLAELEEAGRDGGATEAPPPADAAGAVSEADMTQLAQAVDYLTHRVESLAQRLAGA